VVETTTASLHRAHTPLVLACSVALRVLRGTAEVGGGGGLLFRGHDGGCQGVVGVVIGYGDDNGRNGTDRRRWEQ
jgi:hypothetical protein